MSHAVELKFGVHPLQRRKDIAISCVADFVDRRHVTSSDGQSEKRYVNRTAAVLGELKWPIELSLTNRKSMRFRMLLGRAAVSGLPMVDPAKSYLSDRSLSKLYPKANILVQEYVKESKGSDIRCFVVGGKIVASMMRQGGEGEFRSNIDRGGKASNIRITPEERSTAVRAAKIMGLNVAGVDMLRSNHSPVVMEVNSSSGLEGI